MTKVQLPNTSGRNAVDVDDDGKRRGEKVLHQKREPRNRRRRPKTERVVASPKPGV